ncbi:hypothetical protein D3C72_1959350 [compost metagenome]
MPQRDVIGRRERLCGEGIQRTNIDVAHRVGRGDADGGQMAGSDDGQRQAQRITARTGGLVQGVIVVGDRLLQRLLFLHPGLTGAAGEQIARAQKRNGAQYRTRLAVALIQHQHLLFDFALRIGDHGGIQAGK